MRYAVAVGAAQNQWTGVSSVTAVHLQPGWTAPESLRRGNTGPAPVFVGETAGKVRLTSGGAFRIAHEKAFSAIGWKPEVEMREGLSRLIRWLKEGNG
jgi:nucleoside-diphosphate-sugar epimerase